VRTWRTPFGYVVPQQDIIALATTGGRSRNLRAGAGAEQHKL
jgi:hypothetical protein